MINKRKLLSQNFFVDQKLVAHLVGKACFGKNDVVIDIGAGTGIISRELAKTCGRVIAVEIDDDLINTLARNLKNFPKVQIINNDIRQFQLPTTTYKVFANLPFHITADIIYKLLYNSSPPAESYLVVQKEAALKFTGSPRETQFSILAKPYFNFQVVWEFKKTDFDPEPNVDTVLLKITKRKKALVPESEIPIYNSFVKFAFGTWKKDLKIGLKKVFTYEQWKRLAKDNKFNIHAKPTELTFPQWLSVFRYYQTIKK